MWDTRGAESACECHCEYADSFLFRGFSGSCNCGPLCFGGVISESISLKSVLLLCYHFWESVIWYSQLGSGFLGHPWSFITVWPQVGVTWGPPRGIYTQSHFGLLRASGSWGYGHGSLGACEVLSGGGTQLYHMALCHRSRVFGTVTEGELCKTVDQRGDSYCHIEVGHWVFTWAWFQWLWKHRESAHHEHKKKQIIRGCFIDWLSWVFLPWRKEGKYDTYLSLYPYNTENRVMLTILH